MNKRQSQRIKQRGNAASEMFVAPSRSSMEIATEKPMTQLDFFQSKTATPNGPFYKNGWFHSHKLQQGILKESKIQSLLFMGDSIAYGFKCHPHIWDKYYGNLALNCGIAGDNVEKALWTARNLTLLRGIEYAVIICGTNNIDYNEASSIANGLICVPLILASKSVQQVIISGIPPRGFVNTIRRDKIKEVIELLKTECFKLTSIIFYMGPQSDWVTNKNLLNMKYFYRDNIHLIE